MPRNSITGKVTRPYNLALEEINEEHSLISHIQANYDDINDLSNNCLDIRGTNNMRNNINMNTNKTITVKEGELPSNLATVSQVRKGRFGVDNSTDEATIDLVENPASTTEYSEGLIITFKATKNSVNNMTVQINGLGYKELDKKQIGIGSFVKDDIVKLLYNKDTDKFVSLNEKNQPINYYGLASDLNEFIVPIKQMITIDASTKNIPNSDLLQNNESKALLEVAKKDYKRNGALDRGWYLCEIQTLTVYLDTAHTYTRERLNEVWGSWNKEITESQQDSSQMKDFKSLAKISSANGKHLINKSNGQSITKNLDDDNYFKARANQSIGFYVDGKRYNARFYSTIVCDNFDNYTTNHKFSYAGDSLPRPSYVKVFHYVWAITDWGGNAVFKYIAWMENGVYKCLFAEGASPSSSNWAKCIDMNTSNIVAPFENKYRRYYTNSPEYLTINWGA